MDQVDSFSHHELESMLSVMSLPFMICRGAAEGEGLGNAFLSHIQAVDGIFHVCRGFEDPEVTHVEDRVDPVEDLEIIHKYDPASKQMQLACHPVSKCAVHNVQMRRLHLLSKYACSMNCHATYSFQLHLDYILGELRTAAILKVLAWHDQCLVWHLRAAASCV